MATIFWMNKEIARGMVCFFHQKKHSYLIYIFVADVFISQHKLHTQYLRIKSIYKTTALLFTKPFHPGVRRGGHEPGSSAPLEDMVTTAPRRRGPAHFKFHTQYQQRLGIRVARWFVFKPKIPILVKIWKAFEW
jgi:hypothetical protein